MCVVIYNGLFCEFHIVNSSLCIKRKALTYNTQCRKDDELWIALENKKWITENSTQGTRRKAHTNGKHKNTKQTTIKTFYIASDDENFLWISEHVVQKILDYKIRFIRWAPARLQLGSSFISYQIYTIWCWMTRNKLN